MLISPLPLAKSELFPEQEAGAFALTCRAQVMRSTAMAARQRKAKQPAPLREILLLEPTCDTQEISSSMVFVRVWWKNGGHSGKRCGHARPLLMLYEAAQPPNLFNDAKKYGPHAELYFFLQRSITRETEHMNRNNPIPFSFTRLEDVRPPAGNDPLSQEALEGVLWPSTDRSQWPRGRRRVFFRAQCLHALQHLLFAPDAMVEATHRVF